MKLEMGADSASASVDFSTGSPGSILRRCREFHGISLEEASETTKIGVSHLKALENDQIQEFANQAYLKGFLRIYATYLGLNSEDVARLYEKLFGVQTDKIDPANSITPPSQPRRLISLKNLIFPALLLLIIILTAIFLKPAPQTALRAQAPPVTTVSVQSIAVQRVQSSSRQKDVARDVYVKKAEKPVEVAIEPDATPPPKSRQAELPKSFIIKMKVTQNGMLTATVDGSAAQQYDLTIGDIIEWKAEKKVALDLSNAGGVDLEINGKPYKSLGPAGKPAYLELDADGVRL